MKKSDRIFNFVEILWNWFDTHKRELPWRDCEESDHTKRAYRILVSEIMLQQTQVSRVIPMYRRFLEVFPRIDVLAEASNAEVVRHWRGMGYNNRALRLRDAARTVQIEYGGVFPTEMQDLLRMKGIGHYTAAAVRNFAFFLPTACIDTNIRRILHRTFVGPENRDGTWKKDDRYLLSIAEEVLEEALRQNEIGTSGRTSATWHAALMDFGSLVCTRRNPHWEICPLTKRGICKASYKVKFDRRTREKEPGRAVGGRSIPNRIFRGRIVDELRDAQSGLTLEAIGSHVCIDWSKSNHKKWLEEILADLQRDQLIQKVHTVYTLVD